MINGSCPLGPSFDASSYDPYELSTFSLAHDFNSSYAFATFSSTVRIKSGDAGAPDLACISANITPNLGGTLTGLLTYLPVAVLVIVAIATAAAAIYSPWGTTDPFKWTTNYGRDEDLLRLVTPGFGDCLQYIQFIFLTGGLTLNYPGFFQPATSNVGWSALLFNESFVSHGPGYQSLVDGVYVTNGTYGMTRMSQLIGMTATKDTWACMAVWLLVICVIAVIICQVGFVFRWIYRYFTNTTEEDLRSKNWPLSGGMVVRVMYNYFLLPIVALSTFQLVTAARSPASVVAMAVVLLLAIIAFAGWILILIFRTKPRASLFDDLPTVLLYGSLYNTYSDEAAPFALIPAVLTFMRGVAIGAVQPSGIAQLIILAICEVILILTLHAFKPFHSPTHMNAYHTFFASARLAAVLLSVAFVPSLGVTQAPKGWIGYAILLLHAIVLIFGFFLNSIQTVIEVGARMAGVGGDPQHGAQRGGLISYSWRQLSKRQPGKGRPGSMTSDAAILATDGDAKTLKMLGGRSRSMSASSQILLSQHLDNSNSTNRVSGFDQYDPSDYNLTPGGRESPSGAGLFPSGPSSGSLTGGAGLGLASAGKRPILGIKTEQPLQDPYYRPPRQRRNTNDPYTPGAKSRHSGEWNRAPYIDSPEQASKDSHDLEAGDLAGDSPMPAYLKSHHRGISDPDLADLPRERTDYAVREVDFYYGVRGPALSEGGPTRKLKTGPADPMGPVSSASTWFNRMFKGKSKEKHSGFEVVRSARMPPRVKEASAEREAATQVEEGQEMQTSPPMSYPPYRDSPDLAGSYARERDLALQQHQQREEQYQQPQASGGAERDLERGENSMIGTAHTRSDSPDSRTQYSGSAARVRNPERRIPSGISTKLDGTWDADSSDGESILSDNEDGHRRNPALQSSPYSLPEIKRHESINLGSGNTDYHSQPAVPVRSSRRTSSGGTNTFIPTHRFQSSLGGASLGGASLGGASLAGGASLRGDGTGVAVSADQRPTSIGQVSQRNTGDATVFTNHRALNIGQGDSAEFLDEGDEAPDGKRASVVSGR